MDPLTLLIILVFIIGVIIAIGAGARARKSRGVDFVTTEKFNTLAVLSFVLSFFVAVAAIVLGHIALSQINRTHERGWGLAFAGLIIGYFALFAGAVVLTVLLFQFANAGF